MTETPQLSSQLASSADWEQAACVPSPGDGLVSRLGAVTLVVAPARDADVAPILDQVQIVAANGGSGRQLVRGFALQLSTAVQDPPSFVAVAPIDRGLAVIAVGEGTAEIDGEKISGRDSLAWVEKVVGWPVRQVALYVGESPPPGSSLLDLRDGVVGGAGCVLTADPDAAAVAAESAVAAVPGGADAGLAAAAAGAAPEPPALAPKDFGRHRRASDMVEADVAELPSEPPAAAVREIPVPAPPVPPEPPAAREVPAAGSPAAPAAPVAPAAPAAPVAPAAPAAPAAPTPPGASRVPQGEVAAHDHEHDHDHEHAHAQVAPAGPPVARRPEFAAGPAQEAFESVLIGVDDFAQVSVPTPLPVAENVSPRSRVATPAAPGVKGVFCKNDHFNDPRMLFCAVCGINMVQQTPVLVDGVRPPLGVIVLDDGSVFQLDSDYLLGRDPEADERAQSGDWRAIALEDSHNAISRVHARIELRLWDVVLVDNTSTNGTFYAEPKGSQWVPIPRGGEQVLQPGWRIRIGHRTLAFNTHRG